MKSMTTDKMKSKEDKICYLKTTAVKPKVMEESETKPASPYKGLIDTAAPFESVREVVTKFGGIIDWKAHKVEMMERRKIIQVELEKTQKEIPQCKQELEAAEVDKSRTLHELESTKIIMEELKHDLEKAQMEEVQAKQDSELARLRAQEIERGVADESSSIATEQIKVAKDRHEKCVAELKSVNEELRELHEQKATMIDERDIAMKRAEEVASAGKEIERRLEGLTLELIASKGSLELAHGAHHEAQERRIGAELAKQQDHVAWDRELVQAQEELQQLNNNLQSRNELEQDLDANLLKLHELKSELSSYMENILSKEAEGFAAAQSEDTETIGSSIKKSLTSAQKELDEVRGNIQNAAKEAMLLRVASTTLRSELDDEKASLVTLQQKQDMASVAVSSLEAELNMTRKEIESVRSKEEDTQERMVELPKILQQAAQEAEEAKVAAHSAEEQLRRAKEEAHHTSDALTTANSRLCAVAREAEASKASEKLALAAIQALIESREAIGVVNHPRGVTLTLSEYYALSKRAHEAEVMADEKVAEAMEQVQSAKLSESESLDMLTEASMEMDEKKKALEIAMERFRVANDGKLAAEQALRKWRSDRQQRRRAQEAAAKGAVNPVSSPPGRLDQHKDHFHHDHEPQMDLSGRSYEDTVSNRKLRKKSFLPGMGSLLSRKNSGTDIRE